MALVRVGRMEAADILADEIARRDEGLHLVIGLGLILAWAGFAFPMVWLNLRRWLFAVTVPSGAAALLVVGAAALGGLAGTAVGLLAGVAAAALPAALLIRADRRRGLSFP